MKRMVLMILSLLFAALLIVHPSEASEAVRGGLSLCARTVIPSLFPFFVVSGLLLRLGAGGMLRSLGSPFMMPLFRLRGVCALPLAAGLLGGYPTGAKTASELYEQGTITKGEAERLLGFCNNCGPGFLLGYVGQEILGNARFGAHLFLIHAASALTTGMLLCRLPHKGEPLLLSCPHPARPVSVSEAFVSSVSSALTSVLHISAHVDLFRAAAALIGGAPAGVLGILEMVSGIAGLSADKEGFVAAAALTAWGGLSVHCQTMSVSGELSLRYHTAGKILQTVISVFLAFFAAKWVYR